MTVGIPQILRIERFDLSDQESKLLQDIIADQSEAQRGRQIALSVYKSVRRLSDREILIKGMNREGAKDAFFLSFKNSQWEKKRVNYVTSRTREARL